MKGKCVTCGGHIEFDPESMGRTVPCPHCGVATLLMVRTERPPVEPAGQFCQLPKKLPEPIRKPVVQGTVGDFVALAGVTMLMLMLAGFCWAGLGALAGLGVLIWIATWMMVWKVNRVIWLLELIAEGEMRR